MPLQRDNESPAFAVIVTAFNRAKYLDECLSSVVNQTFSDFELIIVDDGSTDNTQEVVSPFLNDSRVSYRKKANGGQASALNLGITATSAPLVTFLDSDCSWHPTRLEAHWNGLQRNPEAGVFMTDNVIISESSEIIGQSRMPRFSGDITDHLLYDNYVPFNSVTVRRSIIDQVSGFNESLRRNPDYDFWLRASMITTFLYSPEFLTNYRVFQDQLSTNKEARFASNKKILFDFLDNNMDSIGWRKRRRALSGFYRRRGSHALDIRRFSNAFSDAARGIVMAPWSLRSYRFLAKTTYFFIKGRA